MFSDINLKIKAILVMNYLMLVIDVKWILLSIKKDKLFL